MGVSIPHGGQGHLVVALENEICMLVEMLDGDDS